MEQTFTNLLINSIGAVAVALAGLVYLFKRDNRDREKDQEERQHVEKIASNHLTQMSEMMQYIRERDRTMNDAMTELATAVRNLTTEIKHGHDGK